MTKVLGIIILAILITIAIVVDIDINVVILSLQQNKLAGALGFVVLATIATILFIPGSLIGIVGGLVFGAYFGTLLVVIGATLGSICSFLISRYYSDVEWLKTSKHYQKMDQFVSNNGTDILVITRLFPIFPFNIQNYYYGLTSISLKKYSIITFITLIPGTFIYVYFANRIYYNNENFTWYFLAFSLILVILYVITKVINRRYEFL